MAHSYVRHVTVLGMTAAAVLAVACGEPPAEMEDAAEIDAPLTQCTFAVTRNVYDGPSWWGTIGVTNTSAASVTGVSVSFGIPNGVRCDYAPAGWTYTQSGSTCTYKKTSGAVAPGARFILNYSTSSQSFSSATSVKVSGANCAPAPGAAPTPGTAAGPTPPASPTNLQWRKANLTNFTSYPDPGSEECIAYNGCMWAGQFAGVSGKQPESWVKANNIIAIHSKDFAAYKLKTLRLRQGTKQIDAKVYDMCADSDCSGCCTANSRETGFLIDVEKYTMERFGTGDGIVEWACLDCK